MSNNEQIKTIQQTFMEVAHAQHNGSAWYTKGDSGLYQQVSMWLGRGQAALDDLEKQLAERDAALARCVEELEAAALFCSERGHDKAANHLYKMVASLPTSAQATAKVLAAARHLVSAWDAYNTSDFNDLGEQSVSIVKAESRLREAIREEQETK